MGADVPESWIRFSVEAWCMVSGPATHRGRELGRWKGREDGLPLLYPHVVDESPFQPKVKVESLQ